MIKFVIGKKYKVVDIFFVVMAIISIIILVLPNSTLNNTAFYSVETPSNIVYKYTSFAISYLIIPVIVFGLVRIPFYKGFQFWKIIIAVFLIDILIISRVGGGNIIATGRFEMFFIMLQAWATCEIALSDRIDVIDGANWFLDIYFLIGFVTLLYGIANGYNSLEGRAYIQGLGVGGTGYFAAIYLLHCIYCRKQDMLSWIRLSLGLFTLIVSGQRTSIFVFIVFLIPFFHDYVIKRKQTSSRKLISTVIYIFFILIVGTLFISTNSNAGFIARTTDAFKLILAGKLSSEGSVAGRWGLNFAGLQILKENPLGLANDYYELQYRIGQIAFPTFPHSTIISDTLLWSTPVSIYCCYQLVKIEVILFRNNDSMKWILLFLLVMAVIWGGPELSPAPLVIKILFASLAKIEADKYKLSIEEQYVVQA